MMVAFADGKIYTSNNNVGSIVWKPEGGHSYSGNRVAIGTNIGLLINDNDIYQF